MFERFSGPARQVVVVAAEEARALKHNYIGTEHLLLGLLRETDGAAARSLQALGIRIEDVRGQVARMIGRGDEAATGQIPFTPRAKKVLELSLGEALALGHDHIGPEHVLLGLVREGEGVASQILLDFGADAGKVRGEVVRALGTELPADYEKRMSQVAAGGHFRSYSRPNRPFARSVVFAAAIAFGVGILIGWAIWG